MSELIATSQVTLMNLTERAIDRTEVTFWHGLSATKHPLGVYDCGGRDHTFGNEFNVTSGKTYTVRVIAKQTKGSIGIRGGIWYTAMTSGNAWDGIALFNLVGEASEDGLGIYERKFVVASDKTKAKIYIQLEQWENGYTTAWRIYDGQVFDENGKPLVTDQNNLGALTNPMAAPNGTYIWKRTITYYTDGTNNTVWEYSGVGAKGAKGDQGLQGIQGPQGPKGDQGIPGPKGADGKTQYTHIAYADNATGGGFSQTDQTKAYIGMYVDFTEADSNDPTKYKWSKWKGSDGAQGIPGPKGADGKTPYIHFAYADDDKGTNFSLTDNNQQFQGYYSDYTEADSTDYTKYKWVDRLANVKVSGVNLLKNTKAFKGSNITGLGTILSDTYQGCAVRYLKSNNSTSGYQDIVQFSNCVYPKLGGEYVVSFWAKGSGTFTAFFYGNGGYLQTASIVSSQGSSGAAPDGKMDFILTNDWQRYWIKYKLKTAPSSATAVAKHVLFRHNANGKEEEIWLAGCKLEEANIPTPYSEAPEDTQEQIDSKADQALTQDQLNALEAKRLQMEVELKAKATLEQVSELETFINNLKQEDTDGRQKIIEIAKAIEERVKNIEPIMEYSQKLQFMDTYITQGNGGMVIGANESTTKVVVTPDRISFQSGGSEVAYISQRMLHIDNGVFTMSLQLGHYITRAHPKNEYVNATYFVK